MTDLRVHVVLLRAGTEPVFPAECVVCRTASPGDHFWYVTRDGMHGRALWRGWLARHVPACRSCGLRVQLGLAWSFVRTVVVGLGSMGLAAWLLYPHLAGTALGLACFGVTCVCLVALVLWERGHPPVFSIALEGATVSYRFRERVLAARFARANGLTLGSAFED